MSNKLEEFGLDLLGKMDGGRLRITLEDAIRLMHEDCRDRPGLKKPRKIVLQISMDPIQDGNELESVNVDFSVKATPPGRTSRIYNMRSDKKRGLLFNDASPDAARQGTMDVLPGPGKERHDAS